MHSSAQKDKKKNRHFLNLADVPFKAVFLGSSSLFSIFRSLQCVKKVVFKVTGHRTGGEQTLCYCCLKDLMEGWHMQFRSLLPNVLCQIDAYISLDSLTLGVDFTKNDP